MMIQCDVFNHFHHRPNSFFMITCVQFMVLNQSFGGIIRNIELILVCNSEENFPMLRPEFCNNKKNNHN